MDGIGGKMNPIIGKWQQPEGQPYAGLWFWFKEDGTFQAEYDAMGITSGGTYQVVDDLISIDQSQHSLGLIGKFEGRIKIDNDTLLMTLGNPGEKAPDDVSKGRLYQKV
jgi:hypothetical protein